MDKLQTLPLESEEEIFKLKHLKAEKLPNIIESKNFIENLIYTERNKKSFHPKINRYML
jgi:hypothetical protein